MLDILSGAVLHLNFQYIQPLKTKMYMYMCAYM